MRGHVIARILANVTFDENTHCWVYGRSTQGTGYCQIGTGEGATKLQLVHRVMYAHTFGPIPKGWAVDHRCRNRRCVNPAHLQAVPASVNTERAKVARRFAKQGLCAEGLHEAAESPVCAPCARDLTHVFYIDIEAELAAEQVAS